MTRSTVLRFLLPISLLVCLWSACKKNDFQNPELADHEAEFAFPLFTTDLLLKDLLFSAFDDSLSEDNLVVNPNGTITLFYTGDVVEKKASDVFTFFQNTFVPVLDSSVQYPLQVPNGVTIRQAKLNAGTLTFGVFNTLSDTVTGYFEIVEMTKDGHSFTAPFVIPPNDSMLWVKGPIDISGYELHTGSNNLTFKYFAYKPDGTRVSLPAVGDIFTTVIVSVRDLRFQYFEGYFGYSRYPLTRDTIEIDINQENLQGDVKIKNPKVTMRIANSWGFPTRGIIKYLSFIGQDGQPHELISNVFQNDSIIDFAYPAINEVGQEKFTDIVLDETNSNIAEIFNSKPTKLIYELDGISNAQQNPNVIGFLTDSSNISLQLRVQLDLEGSVKNYASNQNIDLNFGDYSDLDTSKIQDAEFKLVTENGTPVSALLQMYFLDTNGARFDSLFQQGPQLLLRAAPIDADGRANGSTRTEQFIPMTAQRFDRIRRAKQAFMQTSFTSAENGQVPVTLIASDKAIIKMGLKVSTKF